MTRGRLRGKQHPRHGGVCIAVIPVVRRGFTPAKPGWKANSIRVPQILATPND
jgi:hypothetical protein